MTHKPNKPDTPPQGGVFVIQKQEPHPPRAFVTVVASILQRMKEKGKAA